MADFLIALPRTLKHEGGYVNDPSDPGGETNYGITKAVALANGYTGPMKDIPMAVVQGIYKKRYWDALCLGAVKSQKVANEVFDTGVNCGIGVAAMMLQRALNLMNKMQSLYPDIPVDGKMGPGTVAAVNACTAVSQAYTNALIHVLNALQVARYAEITEKNARLEKFFFGWIANRTQDEP